MYDLDADPAYRDIPERIMAGLLGWGNHGYRPGGFLTCVLMGDLLGAVSLADSETVKHLPAIVRFVWNQMPSGCHALGALKNWSAIMERWEATRSPGPPETP